jgi:ribose 5-phosphate isomerase A
MNENEESAKRAVGRHAIDTYVKDGMCVGLGTGSTAKYAIERTGELIASGMRLQVVATSLGTERMCRDADVPLIGLGDAPIDVAIDGADEVAPDWSLVKGAGGALFREKAVALVAKTFVVIVTRRKIVAHLGAFGVPVEVVPFSTQYVAREIAALGAGVTLRRDGNGKPIATDNGNALLDCRFGVIGSPLVLDRILRDIHGVVATGLFVGLTSHVLVSEEDGSIVDLPPPLRHGSERLTFDGRG